MNPLQQDSLWHVLIESQRQCVGEAEIGKNPDARSSTGMQLVEVPRQTLFAAPGFSLDQNRYVRAGDAFGSRPDIAHSLRRAPKVVHMSKAPVGTFGSTLDRH